MKAQRLYANKNMKWGNIWGAEKSLKIRLKKKQERHLGVLLGYECDSINAVLAIDVWLWLDSKQFFILELITILGDDGLEWKFYHMWGFWKMWEKKTLKSKFMQLLAWNRVKF